MVCGNCGRELPYIAAECPACGYKSGQASRPRDKTQTKPEELEKMVHNANPFNVPEEIKVWNWGAAGLTWIWGLSFGVWISLLTFVPIVNWFWWIVLGIKGNEWAWRKGNYKSVEEFKVKQAKWRPWGIAIFVLGIILSIWQWYYIYNNGGPLGF